MDLDDVLRKLGEFGPFQRRVCFLLFLVGFPAAFNNLGYVFWAARPDHWCSFPADASDDARNISSVDRIRLSIPVRNGKRSQCEMYNYNYSSLNLDEIHELLNAKNRSDDTRECQSWDYDRSQYQSTIVTEWNLVCDRKWLTSTTQALYMVARMVGTVLFGHLADRYGRRPILLVSTVLEVLFAVGTAITPEFYSFLVMRSLLAITATGEFQTAFVIVMEIVGPTWRVFTGTVLMIFWAIAYMMMAGLGYAIRDRMTLQLAASVPMCVLVIYYWTIPETPRWLLSSGKVQKGEKLLQKMAKTNGIDLPDKLDITIKEEKQISGTFIDLLRTPYVRRMSFILFYIWFVNSVVYYGLSLNSSNLGGNDYINFFISGAVEIPAYLICMATFYKFGRRRPLSMAMMLAGVSLLVTCLIPKAIQPVRIFLSMLGKGAITCSYSMVYVYTSELYPTCIRGVAVGTCSTISRMGGALAPYAAEMGALWTELPLVVFGSLAVIAGLVTFALHETCNHPLPNSVIEAERLAKNHRTFSCCQEKGKRTDENETNNDMLLVVPSEEKGNMQKLKSSEHEPIFMNGIELEGKCTDEFNCGD